MNHCLFFEIYIVMILKDMKFPCIENIILLWPTSKFHTAGLYWVGKNVASGNENIQDEE